MERNVVKEIKDIHCQINKYVTNDVDARRMFNMTQLQILLHLYRHEDEDVCQKDFEEETHVKKASITGAIDSLIDKGFVYREQSKDDKRKNYIRLTDKALAYKIDFKNRVDILNERIIENISKEELETFYKVIDKIRENVKEIR